MQNSYTVHEVLHENLHQTASVEHKLIRSNNNDTVISKLFKNIIESLSESSHRQQYSTKFEIKQDIPVRLGDGSVSKLAICI